MTDYRWRRIVNNDAIYLVELRAPSFGDSVLTIIDDELVVGRFDGEGVRAGPIVLVDTPFCGVIYETKSATTVLPTLHGR